MDHRDKIRQNLELLKLDTLKDISLNDLESEIREKFPAPVGDGRRLHVFMAWLHDRLTFIDTSDEFLLSREINEWATFLIFCGYHKLDLADAFDDWCHEQSAIDPSSIRRLELAALEMEAVLSVSFANRRQQRQAIMAERLMPKRGFFALRPLFSQLDEVPETYEPPNKYGVPRVNEVPEVYEISKVNEASLAYGNLYLDRPQLSGRSDPIEVNTMDASGGSLIYGNMHPDRLKLSARNDALEVGVRGGSLVYSNMHPDRLKLSEQRMGDMAGTAIDIDTWKTPFIDLSLDDDSPNRQNDQTTTDLSFLTGANKMVFDNGFLPSEMNRETERTIVDEPSRSDPATDLRHSRYFEGGNIRGGKLPKGYVCKICDIPGHFFNDCPSKKPHLNYTCRRCGITGEHWCDQCPKARDKGRNTKKWHHDKNRPPWRGPPTGHSVRWEEKRSISDSGPAKAYGGERFDPQYHRSITKRRSQSPLPQPPRKRSRSQGFKPTSPLESVARYGSSTHIGAAHGIDRGAEKEARQALGPRVLDLQTRVHEEGRLSYYDDPEEDLQIPLTDRTTRLAPEQVAKADITEEPAEQEDTLETSPAVLAKRCTEDVDALIAAHSVGMIPLELGVTEKSLDSKNSEGKPTYDQIIVKLLVGQTNVWVRKIKRNYAWNLWGNRGPAEHTEEADTVMLDAGAAQVVETPEASDIPGPGSGDKQPGDSVVTSHDSVYVADGEVLMAVEAQAAQGSTADQGPGQDDVDEIPSAANLIALPALGDTDGSRLHENEMVDLPMTEAEPLEPTVDKALNPKFTNDRTPQSDIVDVIAFRGEVVEIPLKPQSAEKETGDLKTSDIQLKLPDVSGPRVGQGGAAGSYKAGVELSAVNEICLVADVTQTMTTESYGMAVEHKELVDMAERIAELVHDDASTPGSRDLLSVAPKNNDGVFGHVAAESLEAEGSKFMLTEGDNPKTDTSAPIAAIVAPSHAEGADLDMIEPEPPGTTMSRLQFQLSQAERYDF